jgi:hypothetical protein
MLKRCQILQQSVYMTQINCKFVVFINSVNTLFNYERKDNIGLV